MRKIFKTTAVTAASLAMGATVALTATGTAQAAGNCNTTAQCAAGSQPTLKVGQRSEDVKRLQRSLSKAGFSVPDTGYYGSLTRAAVIRYQKANGIPTTGVTATMTWGSLQGGKSKAPAANAGGGAPAPAAPAAGGKTAAVNFAMAQIGKPYAYGGNGPNSFDCSGLTQNALRAAGVSIPRTSQDQASAGRRVSLAEAQPGDVVVYYSGASHVGLYIGDGKIVHASRPGRPIAVASVNSMPVNSVVRF